jgi:hypothetical protein
VPLNTTINTCKYINIHIHGCILEWTTFNQISPNTDNVSMRLSRVLVKPDHCTWVLLVLVFKFAIQWWVFLWEERVEAGYSLWRPPIEYKVVQIWPGRFVCKQVTVCPGHIWTTLYMDILYGLTLSTFNTLYYSETVALPLSNPLKLTFINQQLNLHFKTRH